MREHKPGHGSVLQSTVTVLAPTHFFPPLEGGGLSHFLTLFLSPPPQDFEQGLSTHSLQ